MTIEASFKTRARTIDHLGRGQIADSPTAISELWKNAYDAYATNVALHIFDGSPEVAAVFDDGSGMSARDFVERWLVVGTESKLEEIDQAPRETFGLSGRERQGEKGIGRLSAAFLAPAAIVLSKRSDSRFAAVMVDWRLFENPFVMLDDLRLPVEEFDHPGEVLGKLDGMIAALRVNLDGSDDERGERLRRGWERYSRYEASQGSIQNTASAIRATWSKVPLTERHLNEWPVSAGIAQHGTALFLIAVHHELAVWVRPGMDDEEAELVKDRLRETLTGFTDPYADPRLDFDYEVLLNRGNRVERVLAAGDVFGLDQLRGLEHSIDGVFEENGLFSGRVVVFGKDLGIKEFVPRRPPPTTGRDRLGSFSFCIGSFELDPAKSTHSDQQVVLLRQQTDKFGGISVYRDGLRVMPYGRPDADFFEIEERRTRHAGRYFWSHRRSFGRVAFTRRHNPNLRDKAGREGLVENRANRELRLLVQGVLVDFAYRFFGTDSETRQELLPGIVARNAAAREAAEKARTRRRKNVRQFLRDQREPLRTALAEVAMLVRQSGDVRRMGDKEAATVFTSRTRALGVMRDDLRPPPVPTKLGDLEERYRDYRDQYREFVAGLETLGKAAAAIEADVGTLSPEETARRNFNSHQSTLSARIERYLKSIDGRMDAIRRTWRENADTDRGAFYKLSRPLLDDAATTPDLTRLLNMLDANRRELEETFAGKYEPFIRALDQLAEGIDLDGALAVVEDDRSDLDDRIKDLNAVAQVGITVEIIGHELESLDAEVRRNLLRLPEEIRQVSAFKLAFEAHSALTERLRFLSPLKIAGYRDRRSIDGVEIAAYVAEFFDRTFRDNRILFEATPAFRSFRIVDLPSRIFPVFINLVNNAAYWVGQASDRRVVLDRLGEMVIVADSGKGVDPDDVPRLFDLFFTRRRGGRGVGLYLCKVNLAVAHHRIRYATIDDPTILPGANFIIEFRDLTVDG